MFLKTFGSTNF